MVNANRTGCSPIGFEYPWNPVNPVGIYFSSCWKNERAGKPVLLLCCGFYEIPELGMSGERLGFEFRNEIDFRWDQDRITQYDSYIKRALIFSVKSSAVFNASMASSIGGS